MKQKLLKFFRISERPDPPPGFGPSDRTMNPSRRDLGYRYVEWSIDQFFTLIGLILSLAVVGIIHIPWIPDFNFIPDAIEELTVPIGFFHLRVGSLLFALELIAIPAFLVQLVVRGLLVKLSWELRWYMIGEDSIRIREGLWSVHEQTMTVANIQNMIVRQGPIQKWLGIGDLEIHTAGGGAKGGDGGGDKKKGLHVGRLQGIDDPQALRDHIHQNQIRHQNHVRGVTSKGSKSAAHPPDKGTNENHGLKTAANELLREVRALRSRRSLTSGRDAIEPAGTLQPPPDRAASGSDGTPS